MDNIDMPPWPKKENSDVPPLTPELCYRFILTNPHVHLVLSGPKNREQLVQNFKALKLGPLTPEELSWIREYGKQVHAKKKMDYI